MQYQLRTNGMFDKSKYYYFLKIYICYMYGIVVYFAKMFKNIGVRDVIIVYETFIFMSFVWLLILDVLFLLVFVLVLDFDI